jgi:primosomal protein N' (replication factor Y)
MTLPLFPPPSAAPPRPAAATDAPREPADGPIAQVALPLPLEAPLDYLVPPALAASARPGCRVVVPMGGRRVTGIVVSRSAAAAAGARGRLRAIERVVDPEPAIAEDLLDVLRDAADDALCPLGLALAAALPAGSAPREVRRLVPTARGREALARGGLGAAARAVLGALRDGRRPPRAQAAVLRGLVRDGLAAEASELSAPRVHVATERVARVAPGVDVEALAQGELARAPRQAALLRHLAASGGSETGALGRTMPGAAAALRALATRGAVEIVTREAPRDVLGAPLEGPEAPPDLTPDQAAALVPIVDAIRGRRAERFLLHGVTGSGKTEVYLRAVAEALAAGRQALVLVPEIPLTHQILARLRARFGDALAVLHSGLRPGERLEQWERLRRGATPIAVGARSALFAPLRNLGVIVIDEEHDSAYKNEEGFRYHARDLARRRAERAGCPVILGSATPALETRYGADRGELRRLVLPVRIAGRPLPAVEIVDLEKERARTPRGRKLILSGPLRRAMADALADGGQVILFLNRRGFSTRIYCFDCGHAEECAHCAISLVYHAGDQRLRCHYCGYEIAPPDRCSACGAPETALLGLGTERLEEEVRARFPAARVARLDRDTARRRGGTEAVLRGLRDGELDVLVGTQMVAKGHDFPGVRLVGVVAADVGLHLPDFRAAERTFQLLTQVAGRAGRGATPGRVVIQTFVPGHYAIRPVEDHDYERFYAAEIAQRAALGYPPCGELALAFVSALDAGDAEAAGARLAEIARGHAPATGAGAEGPRPFEVLGPLPAPLAKLRDRWRFQVLVRGAAGAAVRAAARAMASEAAALPSRVRISVDASPVHML